MPTRLVRQLQANPDGFAGVDAVGGLCHQLGPHAWRSHHGCDRFVGQRRHLGRQSDDQCEPVGAQDSRKFHTNSEWENAAAFRINHDDQTSIDDKVSGGVAAKLTIVHLVTA